MVAALFTGVETLVRAISAISHPSLQYLNGFGRLEQPHRQFQVYAAFVCRLLEACLVILMDGPRLAIVFDTLLAALAEEMLCFVGMDLDAWDALGQVAGQGVTELMPPCIYECHIALNFIWMGRGGG